MSGALDGAVELLERSLGYTRVMLADVGPGDLDRPTPCVGWPLGRLLAHMEDALDAFTEAAAGRVEIGQVPETSSRVDALKEKACALLGAWTAVRPARLPAAEMVETVEVGELDVEAPLLVATAALEITLHGWDVGQATGRRAPVPADLARGLLPLAEQVIGSGDRGSRFARPRPISADASYDERLLAWAGREPHPTPHPPIGQHSVRRSGTHGLR